MIFESAAAGVFMKNGFVLGCERTREAVYIDPGDEVAVLLEFVAAQQLTVTHILLTHAHIDHISGVAEARRRLGAPIHLHKDDLFLYDTAVPTGLLFGMEIEAPPPVDRYYDGKGPITFGDYSVAVHHTPGHAPGGVCLAVTPGMTSPSVPSLFVGDTLFAGSIGRTDLPGGDHPTLMRAITEVLFAFPDDSPVFSGHGPETTIGRERSSNPFVREYMRLMGLAP